jgi:subtilisin family serine protease
MDTLHVVLGLSALLFVVAAVALTVAVVDHLAVRRRERNERRRRRDGGGSGASAKTSGDRRPNGYVVELRPPGGSVDRRRHLDTFTERHGITARFNYTEAIHGFAADLSDDTVARLQAHPDVLHVSPDVRYKAFGNRQPRSATQLDAEPRQTSWSLKRMGVASLPHRYVSPNVDVYVLDTGIQMLPQLNVVSTVSFMEVEASGEDMHGHGTHVAGIIGARDTAEAAVGVAPGVRLFGVKVLGADGGGDMSAILAGLNYVVACKRADAQRDVVVNMSLGYESGPGATAVDRATQTVIREGCVVCVAAGNEHADATNVSPGHVDEAVTVGAYDRNDRFAAFSNWGPRVDILAGGVDILSLSTDGSYTLMSGTSMAAPAVTGLVALILSAETRTSSATCRNRACLVDEWIAANDARVTNVPIDTTDVSAYVTPQLGDAALTASSGRRAGFS